MAIGDTIEVNDSMQSGYRYELVRPVGQQFDAGFQPHYSPKEMLQMGVARQSYCKEKGSNDTHSKTGACTTAEQPHKMINQMSQILS